MSDPTCRTPSSPRRRGSPALREGSVESPPGVVVEGRRGVAREESARAVALVDVEQLALQLAERLKPEARELPFFGELVDSWLEHIRPRRVAPGNEERLARRLRPLFLETEETLTATAAADLIAAQSDLSPATRNKLQGVGRLVLEHAQACGRWERPNPFALVRRAKEPKRHYELLTLDELARVQRHLREDRRRQFRVALHLGLRPGELMALRGEDVDIPSGVVHVHRSRERDTTKTGTERMVPIHPAIARDLADAYDASGSELVFGKEDGSMERQDLKLTRILRTAMIEADVGVLGFDWKCRRRGCGFKERRLGPRPSVEPCCPRCGFTLWGVPVVRPVRWYDLRHMCATFHHQHGADRVCTALALGHSLDAATTTEAVYTHPTMETMRRELLRWHLPR